MEKWIDLQNYENYYEISTLYNVRRKKGTSVFKKIRNLSLRKHSGGYLYFQITINNKSKNLTYHRVLAQHFIPNLENKPQVNHIDGDKLNNKLNNLEWVTASENMLHAYDNGLEEGRSGEKHHNSKLKEIDVINIRKLSNDGLSSKEIHILYPQVLKSHIVSIIKYKKWKHI